MQKITSILKHPLVYNFLQQIIARQKVTHKHLEKIIQYQPTQKILDIGCGTGRLLNYLPKDVLYTGIDYNAQYILHAKKTHPDTAKFFCYDVKHNLIKTFASAFDIVFIGGVLHHLTDPAVIKTINDIHYYLKPNGKLIVAEPLRSTKMHPVYKFMINIDRGDDIRFLEGYKQLIQQKFTIELEYKITDALRIPYEHVIFKCAKKTTSND